MSFLAAANSWEDVQVKIPKFTRYIDFVAVRSSGTASEVEGHIAIDNIRLLKQTCGRFCTTTNLLKRI